MTAKHMISVVSCSAYFQAPLFRRSHADLVSKSTVAGTTFIQQALIMLKDNCHSVLVRHVILITFMLEELLFHEPSGEAYES